MTTKRFGLPQESGGGRVLPTISPPANHCWLDYTQSRAFDEHNTSVILHRLKDATTPLPIELCDIADRAVEQFGPKASSIQYAEAGIARKLAELMIRLHEQTNSEKRSRVLDSIDQMLRADFHGLQEHLELHATR